MSVWLTHNKSINYFFSKIQILLLRSFFFLLKHYKTRVCYGQKLSEKENGLNEGILIAS